MQIRLYEAFNHVMPLVEKEVGKKSSYKVPLNWNNMPTDS